MLIQPDLNESDRQFVREALHSMVTEDSSVSKACSEAGIDVAGKTGTAEHANEEPDTLFVGFAPYDDPKYVCSVVLQHSDSSTTDAAPVVVQVLKAAIEGEGNASAEVQSIDGYAGESLKSGVSIGSSLGSRGN